MKVNHDSVQTRVREEVREEARQDDEQEARLEKQLRQWKRGATLLGLGLAVSIVALVPFLKGHSLHAEWDSVGKKILLLSMCLLVGVMYAAGITYTCWSYLNGIKKIHRKFAPPGSKYRMGRSD